MFSLLQKVVFSLLLFLFATSSNAQNDTISVKQKRTIQDYLPTLSGTIRGKYEYQPGEGESRFEVRNARIALEGTITPLVEYKAEIDLSDEGTIKMLDAYAGLLPVKGLNIRLGQMRVPFSIDAHRSPHKQYFANRSFIAKQVGSVRDVGAYLGYRVPGTGIIIEGGVFNGSGLTNQKDFWTKQLNFSAKAQYLTPFGLCLQASVQKISPLGVPVYLYDGGLTFQKGRWTAEAEYLRKHYTRGSFSPVDACDAFVCYDLPLKKVFKKMSFLCRYDYMGNHTKGNEMVTTADADTGEAISTGVFKQTDAERQRVTGGITLSFARRVNADIRLNYEKYFYKNPSLAKPSERDKAVVELVIHFPNK